MYDLGFVRYPEFVAADALDYPELLRRAVRRGAWIHTTSDFVRDEVIETFAVPAERVVRVYPGIPPIEGGDAARGRALASSDRYVLAVGTIEPRKNLPDARARLRRAGGRRPRARAWSWRAAAGGAAMRSTPRSQPRTTATVCTLPATCRPTTAATCSRAPRCSRSRRTTRASASPRSKPWRPASRWSPRTPVPSPRSWATRPCSSTPTTSTPSPPRSPPRSPTKGSARVLVERGRARHRAFSWTTAVDELLDVYEAVRVKAGS